jgi:hypothetical protein
MPTVSPSQSNPGDEITAAAINTPVNQLAAVLNGGIDSANIASGGVGTDEVADGAITPQKMLGIDIFDRTASGVAGTPPAGGTGQFYIQCGVTTGTFTSNALDITFPTPFPNGLLCVIPINGNNTTGGGFSVTNANSSKTGFRAQSPSNGAGTVNWIAIGF